MTQKKSRKPVRKIHDADKSDVIERSYFTGFGLAVLLTAISFMIAYYGWMPKEAAMTVILLLGAMQMLVHLRFFLGLGTSEDTRLNTLVMAFTVVLLFLMIGGSMWVMWDLHNRMMP